jgi:glutamate/tyrosine decarboxylase-like PLP-dependent enzyme
VHRYDETTDRLAQAVIAYALERVAMDPPPLDGPRSPAELLAEAGQTVTPEGLGGEEALRVFAEVLAPATISVDHPRYLSFIPGAPSEAAVLFDLVVGASSIYGGSWWEGAGAVYAENQALRWLADLAGFPAEAGGVFVQGGTNGNLSALVAARHDAALRRGGRPARWRLAAADSAHSSVASAAAVMDVDVLRVATPDHRLTPAALRAALDAEGGDDVFAVVATAGSTNLGIVDDLAGVAGVAEERGLWLHVDGAYGLAALAAPSVRDRFAGIERADSFTVDPHKWLFAPFDCCALLYREPERARRAHTQKAEYLDALQARRSWDPSDYAVQLTRRARGLPFWFSLATHGTRAYAEAIEQTLQVARAAADEVRARPELELVREPDLSIVAFRRTGWSAADYDAWSNRLLQEGVAFVVPTSVDGEPATRIAVVNPRTTVDDVRLILDSLRDAPQGPPAPPT